MKGSTRAAAALSIGYVLGRRRKLRTAALMAAVTAVGGKGVGAMALQRGVKMLGSTETFGKLAPQLGEITDTVRGDLLPAGKAAASAAVTSRVDSLTGSLHERAERLRNPAEAAAAGAEGAKKTAGRATSSAGRVASQATGGRRLRRRGAELDEEVPEDDTREARDEDEYENGDLERDEPADDYEQDEPTDEYEDDEPADDYEDDGEPDDGETPRRGAGRRRSPVSRTRR